MNKKDKHQTNNKTTFTTGAQRGKENFNKFQHRFDLIGPWAERRLAETFGEGSAKYGDYNYYKGIPESNLLNHALNHLNLHRTGDTTEDHLAHAVWNLCAIMDMEELHPELLDLYFRKNPKEER